MEEDIKQDILSPVEVEEKTQVSSGSKVPFGSWWKVGVLVMGILLAGSISYTGYQYSQKQPKSTTYPTISPTPIPTPDETANWKTYTNQQLGFSVKIPSQFSAFPATEGPEAGERVDFAPGKPYVQNKYWVWLSTVPNINRVAPDDAVDNYLNAKSTYKNGGYVSINEMPELAKSIRRESFTIVGIKAASLYPILSQTDTKVVYMTTDKLVYSFALQAGSLLTLDEEAMNTFDQILSTFQFTQ